MPGGIFEHVFDAFVGLSRAFVIFDSTDSLANIFAFFRSNRFLVCFMELFHGSLIVAEILLAPDENDRQALAEVENLGDPLFLHIVQGVRRVDSEADQDDMRVRVRQRPKTVVVLLPSSIPKGQLDMLAVDFNIGHIVLEDSGNIDFRESALREDNQEAGLATGTITDNDQLSANLSHGCGRIEDRNSSRIDRQFLKYDDGVRTKGLEVRRE